MTAVYCIYLPRVFSLSGHSSQHCAVQTHSRGLVYISSFIIQPQEPVPLTSEIRMVSCRRLAQTPRCLCSAGGLLSLREVSSHLSEGGAQWERWKPAGRARQRACLRLTEPSVCTAGNRNVLFDLIWVHWDVISDIYISLYAAYCS